MVGLLVAAAVGAAGTWVWQHGKVGPITVRSFCEARLDQGSVELDLDQAANAAVIAGVAVRRGLPARAATIALATAMQESKLQNLTHGDRDSLGLFQQRPSQGWGTATQVRDPVYASNAFYDVLVKIEGYQNLPVTEAAQKVQRSAFPTAYAQHEDEARILASSLTGNSPGTFSCTLPAPDVARQAPGKDGLTPRAHGLTTAAWRQLGATGTARPGDTAGATLLLKPRSGPAAESTRRAWSLASWAVAQASPLNVVEVEVDGRRWQREDGWTTMTGGPARGQVVVRVAN